MTQFTEILDTPDHKEADAWSLVFSAMNIPHTVSHAASTWIISVPEEMKEEALLQITLYEEENSEVQEETITYALLSFNIPYLLLAPLCFVLFYFYVQRTSHVVYWVPAGSAFAAKICQGEWWRSVTALTLHADSGHLLGNMFFGSIILYALCQVIGIGSALFFTLWAGILGNIINAYFWGGQHDSIGASTSVFGALGIVAGLQLLGSYRPKKWKAWIPVAGAIGLLGILGTGGTHTDMGAHFFGFFAGLVLGVFIVTSPLPRLRVKILYNIVLIAFTIILLVTAWLMAFSVINF